MDEFEYYSRDNYYDYGFYDDYDYGSYDDYDYGSYDYDYGSYDDYYDEPSWSSSPSEEYMYEDSSVSEIYNPASPGEAGYGWKYFSDGTVISPDNEYYANNPETDKHELVWSPEKKENDALAGVLPFLFDATVTEIKTNTNPGDAGYGWRYFSDGTAIGPDGKYYSNNPTTGVHEMVYDPSSMRSGGSGIVDSLLKNAKGYFTKTDASGNEVIDWNKITTAGAGLAGAYAGTQAKENLERVGYQGSIPDYRAVRRPVSETYDPNRRPGSSGQRYATDVVFSGPGGPTFEQALATTAAQAADLRQVNRQNPAKEQAMAQGGMAQGLGRYLQGQTDGMADEIPSSIDGDQPAALSHGEFVIPADVVSHLGNGNSDAGAKKLYQMMDKIRVARTGTKKQGREINPDEFTMGGLASGYASGGSVQGYDAGGSVKPTYESNLSNWAGPYVTNMLGKGEALSELPYMGYSGPLTAGASGLQQQAFQQAGQMQTPSAVGQAASTAGNIAGQMQNLNYTPTQFQNQFQAPATFQPGRISNTYNAPSDYQSGAFTNEYKAPTNYQTGQFGSGMFDSTQAQKYMNPYLQASLEPQIAEAQRQAEINRIANASRLTKAGAYGGSRQAIMESEGSRNLASNLANITGTGYNNAYQAAMGQFNADQARSQAAQQATEQSRQFGAGQAANAAQLAAQFGMNAQQSREQSRQFGAGQAANAAQLMAQFGLTAQQANEASRQFASQQGLASAQARAQFGSAAQQAAEQSRQFGSQFGLQGLQGALSAAQAQGGLGAQQNQLNLANLQQLSALGGTQRDIESQGLAADYAQFQEERDYPYKMLQFQQGLLGSLPLSTQGSTTPGTNTLQDAAGGAAALIDQLKRLGVIK